MGTHSSSCAASTLRSSSILALETWPSWAARRGNPRARHGCHCLGVAHGGVTWIAPAYHYRGVHRRPRPSAREIRTSFGFPDRSLRLSVTTRDPDWICVRICLSANAPRQLHAVAAVVARLACARLASGASFYATPRSLLSHRSHTALAPAPAGSWKALRMLLGVELRCVGRDSGDQGREKEVVMVSAVGATL